MDFSSELFSIRLDLLEHKYNEAEIIEQLIDYVGNNSIQTEDEIEEIIQTFYIAYDIPFDPQFFVERRRFRESMRVLNRAIRIANTRHGQVIMIDPRILGIQIPPMEDVKVTLDDEDLSKIKSYTLEKTLDTNCCICLSALEKDETISELNCTHLFHKECIETYFKDYNYKCPLCKEAAGKGKANVEPNSNPNIINNPDVVPNIVSDVVPNIVSDVVPNIVSDVVPNIVSDVVPNSNSQLNNIADQPDVERPDGS